MSEHETGECGGQDNCFECRGIELAALRSQLDGCRAVLVRAKNKLRRYQEKTKGVYEGGEALQFLMPDIDAALTPRADKGE